MAQALVVPCAYMHGRIWMFSCFVPINAHFMSACNAMAANGMTEEDKNTPTYITLPSR